MNRNKKKPPAGEGERLRRLKQLLNSDFSGKDLTVKIRYAPENPETPGPAYDWVKSPKKWIDPAKESTAGKTALQSGQKTYQEICAERGKDWRQAIDETAEVLEYGREKGIEMGGVIFGNGTAAAQQNTGGQPQQG